MLYHRTSVRGHVARFARLLSLLCIISFLMPFPASTPASATPRPPVAALAPFASPQPSQAAQRRGPITSPPVPQPRTAPHSLAAAARGVATTPATSAVPSSAFDHLPLTFTPERGQTDAEQHYRVRGRDGQIFFTAKEAVFALPVPPPTLAQTPSKERVSARAFPRSTQPISLSVMHLRFVGANSAPTLVATNRLPGSANYLLGNERSRWQTRVPMFGGITYRELYPGVDLQYAGDDGHLKGTYVVAPGADWARIRWEYLGARRLEVNRNGDLSIILPQPGPGGDRQDGVILTEHAPIAWQMIKGQQQMVPVRFVVDGQQVRFVLDRYDSTQPLLIDPTLTYSTYLGGSDFDLALAVAVDADGNSYITGRTWSIDFPTVNAIVTSVGLGNEYAFVTKLDPTGSTALYSTYVGDNSPNYRSSSTAQDIALDANGQAYIVGATDDVLFPTTSNAFDTVGGIDAFISVLSDDGSSLIYSTFLGSSQIDAAYSLALDHQGRIAVTGYTYLYTSGPSDFPIVNGFQTSGQIYTLDAFIAVIDPALSGSAGLTYSTFISGNAWEEGRSIAVDAQDNIYITGYTTSTDFPTKNALQSAFGGQGDCDEDHQPTGVCSDVFVTKIDPDETGDDSLIYSTYLGGTEEDLGTGIVVDTTGRAIVGGYTMGAFPLQRPIQAVKRGGYYEGFIAALTSSGSALAYSTYLGGNGNDAVIDVALDAADQVIAVGSTGSTNFPVINSSQQTSPGSNNGFVAQLGFDGGMLVSSTYLGGSLADYIYGVAVGVDGAITVVGHTTSTNFPAPGPFIPYQGTNNGFGDAFVARLAFPILRSDQVVCPLCQQAHAQVGRPIDTRTGNVWTDATDLAVSGDGPPIVWHRAYASQLTGAPFGPLGSGWSHTYATRVVTPTVEAGVAILVSPTGNKLRFQDEGNGVYTAFPGIFGTLAELSGGGYTYTDRDQTEWVFAANGTLQEQHIPQRGDLTFTYTGTPARLSHIADANNSSRYLDLTYITGASGDYIETVSDGARTVTYSYTYDDLTGVSDVMQRTTTYYYDYYLLRGIDNALGEPVERTDYDGITPAAHAIHQTLQDGSELHLQYLPSSTIITTTATTGQQDVQQVFYTAQNVLTGQRVNGQDVQAAAFDDGFVPTAMLDGNGNATSTLNTPAGLPEVQTDGLGHTTRTFYDSQNRPITVTDALGVSTAMTYDGLGNLTQMTAGITTSSALRTTTYYTYSYDVRYVGDSQLTDQSGPDGVVTHYTYTSAGQAETVTAGYGTALAQTTRYQYDSRGRRTHVTTGDGTALARTDVTVYNDDDTVDTTIQNYADGVYDANVSDEDIVTRSGYDGLGRQIWTQDTRSAYTNATHYNAKGQVDWTVRNPRDASRDPVVPTTEPSYDPAQPDANVVTEYGYDGLGRTVLVTETGILTGTFDTATRTFSDATHRVTRTEYDALSRPVTVTLNYVDGTFDLLRPDEDIQTVTLYDGAGNVIWQRDALGRWTKIEYDALNRPFKTIGNYVDGDPATLDGTGFDTDLITVRSYDALGRVMQEITNYVDGTFDVQAPTDDRITHSEYDTLGRVITSTINVDPATLGTRTDTNRVSLTAYDPLTGRTLGQRDPLGRWASQQYDLLGRVTQSIQNCRDGANQALATGCASFDPNTPDRNVTSEMQYDALGRVEVTLDALGHKTQTLFDHVGRVTATIQNYDDGVYDANTPDVDVTASQSYNGLGQTIETTNAVGANEQRSYDGLGQVVQVTDAANRISHTGYDGTGTQRWQETPDGRFTVLEVDGLGRVVATITNYDDGVVQTSDGDAQDLVTRTLYDIAGRRVAQIDAANRRTAFTYDLQDRLLAVTENVATGTCTTAPCDVQTSYAYDRTGNRTVITDANNHTRTFAYDAANQQVMASDALNQATNWQYDAAGRVTFQDDPRGTNESLTYTYDDLDQRTGVSAPNLGTITTQYDGLGRRTALVDGVGTTSFAYDALGRTTDVDAPYTGHVGYGYDGAGRRTALTYSNGRVIDYAYTTAGELETVSEQGTPFVTYTYDQAGRPFTETRANGTVITRTYDLADRLQDLHAVANGTTLSQFQYTVDRAGQRTGVAETLLAPPTGSGTGLQGTYFSDTTFGTAVLTRTDATIDFDWDQGAPDSTVPSDQFSVRWTGTVVPRYSETYTFSTYSDDGVKLEVNGTTLINDMTPHGPTSFDGTITLTAGQAYTITLDYFEDLFGAMVQLRWESLSQPREIIPTSQLYPLGTTIASQGTTPIVQTRAISYTYDGLERLTGAAIAGGTSEQYAYDDAGNRTDVWQNSILVSHQTYNAANQVDGWAYDAVGNLLNDGTTTYTYDTLNRLRRTAAPAAQGFYDYNGDGVLIARGVNSNFTRFSQDLALPLPQILQTSWSSDDTFIYGRDRLAMTNVWGRSWYSVDGLGSVRQTTSDNGTPLSAVDYDAWGVPEQRLSGVFGFTGELQEQNTDRLHLHARWYTPATGTLLGRDPFGGYPNRPYSLHFYQYAYSNPINYSDPSGNIGIFVSGWFGHHDMEGPLLGYMSNPGTKRMADKYRNSIIGDTFALEANDLQETINLIIEAYDKDPVLRCAPDERVGRTPIVLVGHSRGAATIQTAAYILSRRRPDIKIDLVITLGLISFHQSEPPLYKLPNVKKHINILSHFEKLAQTGYDSDAFGFGFSESHIYKADQQIFVREAAHEYLDNDILPPACWDAPFDSKLCRKNVVVTRFGRHTIWTPTTDKFIIRNPAWDVVDRAILDIRR